MHAKSEEITAEKGFTQLCKKMTSLWVDDVTHMLCTGTYANDEENHEEEVENEVDLLRRRIHELHTNLLAVARSERNA